MRASRSDLVHYSSGYQGLGIVVVMIAMVLVITAWSCWISHCESNGLNKFDKAIGIKHAEKGK
jgi:hypothetical protein